MNYVIGIDIGTTNTKAVAYNLEGTAIAQASRTYPHLSPREGFHELDPLVLLQAVTEVIRIVADSCKGHTLACISFSSAMHGIIAVDEKGTPLTNMITWADLRSSEYAKRLKNTEAGDRIYKNTGTPIHAMSPFCKLMWLKEHEPGIFNAAHKFIGIKEFIFFRFFKKFMVDRSVASSTGLLDIHTLNWNEEAMEIAGISRKKLSELISTLEIIRGIDPEFAARLNIPASTPFVAGGSDGCMAHIGSNALRNGDVSLTIGTSGAVRMMIEKPVYDKAQRVFSYVITDDLYLSGGPVNNGGNVLQWFAKEFLKKDFNSGKQFESLINDAMSINAGCDGLVFLPYIYGERAPVWDADARGIFYGVSSIHGVKHFMRAAMEGVSFGLLSILESLEEVVGNVNDIYVGGGFIRSRKWVTLLADVLGKPLYVTHGEDSSAAGAAIVGMKALGIIKEWNEAAVFFRSRETYHPDLEKHKLYRKNFAVYSTLYEKFKAIN